ncbi:MAG: hypothetical protein PHV59_08135, partial [Victivallales bacterium]|nr:hypothetical protein [Victivallales bacterium]
AVEKYYRVYLIDTDIAEIELEIHRLRKMNAYIEKFLTGAKGKVKEFQEFTVRQKAELAESGEQGQQIEEVKKELKEIDFRLKQKLKAQELKNGY